MDDPEQQLLYHLRRLILSPKDQHFLQDPRRNGHETSPWPPSFGPFGQPTAPLPARQTSTTAARLQGSQRAIGSPFTGFRNLSNPTKLNDPTAGPFRRNVFVPSASSTISSDRSTEYLFGQGPREQYFEDAAQGDYAVPGLAAEEIKDLLSNIRPDEDIKLDDDVVIPGLAPHVRLMKHQQAGLFLSRLTFSWAWRG